MLPTFERIAIFAQAILVLYAIGFLLFLAVQVAWKYGNRATPVFIDGTLYALMAMGTAAELALSNDDVYKYASPYFVFYSKSLTNIILAGATAVKGFRSKSYSEYSKNKQPTNGETKQ